MHFVPWPVHRAIKFHQIYLTLMKDFVGKSIVIIMKPSHGRNIASTNTYSKTVVFIPAWCKIFINMPKTEIENENDS